MRLPSKDDRVHSWSLSGSQGNWARTAAVIGIISLFLVYWTSTLLYVCPDCALRRSFPKLIVSFEKIFYQRWSFFAPPPTSDQRLYYTFISKETAQPEKHFEVLEGIFEAKRAHAPFNEKDLIIDYMLSGAIMQTIRYQSRHAFMGHMGHTIDPNVSSLSSIKTLLNYSAIVARANQIDPSKYKVIITVSTVKIEPFGDKTIDRNLQKNEVIVFETVPAEIPVDRQAQ